MPTKKSRSSRTKVVKEYWTQPVVKKAGAAEKKKPPFSLRIPDELRGKLDRQAAKEGRTTGNLIIHILNTWASKKK